VKIFEQIKMDGWMDFKSKPKIFWGGAYLPTPHPHCGFWIPPFALEPIALKSYPPLMITCPVPYYTAV